MIEEFYGLASSLFYGLQYSKDEARAMELFGILFSSAAHRPLKENSGSLYHAMRFNEDVLVIEDSRYTRAFIASLREDGVKVSSAELIEIIGDLLYKKES